MLKVILVAWIGLLFITGVGPHDHLMDFSSWSVSYEFIEWAAALILGQDADAFLGTQGDSWDTQWDMFMATVGSIAAQLIYRKNS